MPCSPMSVVTLDTGRSHMASGEGDGVREGVRVRVRVGDEVIVRERVGVTTLVRDGVGLRVRVGEGMERLAGRQGSATPRKVSAEGTAVWL